MTWLDWPSAVRGPMREDEAKQLGRELVRASEAEARSAYAKASQQAYRFAAYIAEVELSDGRGGEPLYEAAEAFCRALQRGAGT